MMNNSEANKNYSTFLFKKESGPDQSSYLSEFMAFIKSRKITSPLSFSYVGDQTNLMPNLSLNENILMNFSPRSLTAEKENQFEDFLAQRSNIYIKKLYDKMADKDMAAHTAVPEMKKLASLIKVLTTDCDYIFLENLEKDLSENIRILFIKALEIHLEEKEISAFFYSSSNEELWTPHCSYAVSRNKYFQFQLESINVDGITKKTAA